MNREELDGWWEGTGADREEETGLDFEADMVSLREGIDAEPEGAPNPSLEETGPGDEPGWMIDSADLDNVLDELADLVNARDLDGCTEMLAPDAVSDFLGGTSAATLVDGLGEMLLRNPSLILTRGETGAEPILAAWLFDSEEDGYDLVGYFTVELTETEDRLIQQLEYVDEIIDPDQLTVEVPEHTDLPEWDDWSTYAEG
jgi:hypothetical protein